MQRFFMRQTCGHVPSVETLLATYLLLARQNVASYVSTVTLFLVFGSGYNARFRQRLEEMLWRESLDHFFFRSWSALTASASPALPWRNQARVLRSGPRAISNPSGDNLPFSWLSCARCPKAATCTTT